jgi:hypothetical protein
MGKPKQPVITILKVVRVGDNHKGSKNLYVRPMMRRP